jgi:tetratricopeptide (TPR) repeat protein
VAGSRRYDWSTEGAMKRALAVTFLVGAGFGLSGCQSAGLGSLALWNRDNSAVGSTAPDVSKQKYSGLSQQLSNQRSSGSVGMGGPRTSDDGVLMASWKKTSAAVTGALAVSPKATAPEDDPTRLDKLPKKIGAEVYVGAARLLENQGKYAEAEEKYRDALRAAPNDVNALVSLARLYDRQGQGQKAIETYHKASQANPSSSLVFNDAGMCFRRQRQLDKAIIAFRRAVDLAPDNTKYRNNLAAALVDAGRYQEAYNEFSASNAAAVAHYNLAYLLQQKGEHAEAERHLREALAIDPGLTPAREMLTQFGRPSAQARPTTIEQPAPRPAPQPPIQTAVQPSTQLNPAYVAGASEQSLYTSAPHVEAFIAGESAPAQPGPSSYHVTDDSGFMVENTQRPEWASASWAISKSGSAPVSQPLPPTD